MKAPIVLAVDTKEIDTAKRWVAATSESISVIKLGLEFFLNFGAEGVKSVCAETDADLFLDLKLHDIPNTVSAAATAVSSLQPHFLTVHAAGGASMISAAAQALPSTRVTAVTILTSLSESDLVKIGFKDQALPSAVRLAQLAVPAGAGAIVCSPLEVAAIRDAVGLETILITPGVRPMSEAGSDDQKRTMTPRDAISAGANYVVIGRPITQAWKDGEIALRDKARAIAAEILN